MEFKYLDSSLVNKLQEQLFNEYTPKGKRGVRKFSKIYNVNMNNSIDSNLNIDVNNESFNFLLKKYMKMKNLDENTFYKKANISYLHFMKIYKDEDYHPHKKTIFKMGMALKLSFDEMTMLLRSAHRQFLNTNIYDCIIKFLLINKIYDPNQVNELLSYYKLKPLLKGE